jgi:mono/diheme cytochrome c family protein
MKTLTTLAVIGVLAIFGVIAAAVFFFGGFYNVAATEEDPAVVNWALVHIRRASIARHAIDTPPLSLDDAAVVQEGARAFSERGCVNCHGAPGVSWAKFSEGLRPDPPDLKELVDELRPQDLFWVVKHGIHMTGMPSFGLIEVPDREIWTIVAFLKKLPSVTEEDFKAWSTKP